MPIVRSAVFLTLAASVEARVSLAEDLGLLQGMHMTDLKGRVDATGSLSLDDAESGGASSSLLKTAESLKSMVQRVATGEEVIDSPNVADTLTAFQTMLGEYERKIAGEVETLKSELTNITTAHDACASPESSLDAANLLKAPWELADQALTTAEGELAAAQVAKQRVLNDTIGLQASCDQRPPDRSGIAAYFDRLNGILAKKGAYDAAVDTEQAKLSAVSNATSQATGTLNAYRAAVCNAQGDTFTSCQQYVECVSPKQNALSVRKQAMPDTLAVLNSESKVIKRAKCYVEILITHHQIRQNNNNTGPLDLSGELNSCEQEHGADTHTINFDDFVTGALATCPRAPFNVDPCENAPSPRYTCTACPARTPTGFTIDSSTGAIELGGTGAAAVVTTGAAAVVTTGAAAVVTTGAAAVNTTGAAAVVTTGAAAVNTTGAATGEAP